MKSNRTHIIPRKLIDKIHLKIVKLIYGNGLLLFIGHYTSFSRKIEYGQDLSVLQKIEQTQTINLRQMIVYIFVYLVGISLATFIFILEKIPLIKYRKQITKKCKQIFSTLFKRILYNIRKVCSLLSIYTYCQHL